MSRIVEGISVIIPAYNEGPSILNTIRETVRILNQHGIAFEIIVVDDGSSDNTYQEALRSKSLGGIKYLRNESNMGKGHAIRKGFELSGGKLITFIDADMDLHPVQIPPFLEYMERYQAQMVVGSKRHPRSRVTYPWTRKMLSLAYRLVIKALFRLSVKDTQVGLKLIKREVLERALPLMEVERYAFDLELMVIANRYGYRIVEAPIMLDFKRPFAKIGVRDIYTIFMNTLSVFFRMRTRRYDGVKNEL
jgi:glycosyltransferase involved in cell wall biosynthesis